MLMATLAYGLVVLFFGLLAAFILVLAKSEAGPQHAPAPTSPLTSTMQPGKLAYGLVALLFIAMIVLTMLGQREDTRSNS